MPFASYTSEKKCKDPFTAYGDCRVVSILRHKIERASLAGGRFSEILILLSSMLTNVFSTAVI